MQIITAKELLTRQNWSLNQKIDHTCGAIEGFLNYCAEQDRLPYVAFSGGLNSTVLLDLGRRFLNPDLKGIFCSTGNEFPEIVQFARHTDNVEVIRPEMTPREVLKVHGFPLVSKEQAQAVRQIRTTRSDKLRQYRLHGDGTRHAGTLSKKWRYLLNEPYMVSEKCCEVLKKRPFRKFNRRTRSIGMVGTMVMESRLRRMVYLRHGGCNVFTSDPAKAHSAPLSLWTAADCWDYIHRFDIPYSPIYNIPGVNRTGCMFCGFGAQYRDDDRFGMLYRNHPKIYRMAMEYTNNGCCYRYALQRMGVKLPEDAPNE